MDIPRKLPNLRKQWISFSWASLALDVLDLFSSSFFPVQPLAYSSSLEHQNLRLLLLTRPGTLLIRPEMGPEPNLALQQPSLQFRSPMKDQIHEEAAVNHRNNNYFLEVKGYR